VGAGPKKQQPQTPSTCDCSVCETERGTLWEAAVLLLDELVGAEGESTSTAEKNCNALHLKVGWARAGGRERRSGEPGDDEGFASLGSLGRCCRRGGGGGGGRAGEMRSGI
jgi:hypothetical protein